MTRGKSTKKPPTSPVGKTPEKSSTSRRSARMLFLAFSIVALLAAAAGTWWATRSEKPAAAVTATVAAPINAAFTGSDSCKDCHAEAYSVWSKSQHARAMQRATADTVLGNFDQSSFSYAGVESTFFQRDGRYFVRTDGSDGELAEFEITYTFGIAPLQQYLVPFPDGRLQALSIAWDSRPENQGGQRWFHLYPDEKVDYRDELHWTRASQNWNFMCADCHSTKVEKNYDARKDQFKTTWNEISVGCEACHGPGSAHIDWARSNDHATRSKGLTVDLSERSRAVWVASAATGKPVRNPSREVDTEIQVCAQCHSRRSQVAQGYHAGLPFQDFYRPSVLSPDLYYADGQQLGEVYKWGSFVQSRMYHAGVTCGDCHEPHGQALRASGNSVCGTCHLATRYDTSTHHHHEGDGGGTRCVDCHMPPSNYMVVDPRHDHGMQVPRPDLTVRLGVPNPCSQCHVKQDAAWAAGTVRQWYGHDAQGLQRYAEVLARAESGETGAARDLVSFASDRSQPAIARASALEAMIRYPAQATIESARGGLTDRDPLVRRASMGILSLLPPDQKLPLLAPLLEDSIRTVRMEAASSLADAMGGASPGTRAAFDSAAAEFVSAQLYNADRPEARAALGNFYARQGRADEAENHLRSALVLDPEFVPAYVNLADLMRMLGRDEEAESVLRQGLFSVPDSAALRHALGLTLVRLGRNEEALAELELAAKISPDDARFAYVYAVALNSAGDTQGALHVLEQTLKRVPNDRDLRAALVHFHREAGNLPEALLAAEQLAKLAPDDPGVQRLLMEIRAIQPD